MLVAVLALHQHSAALARNQRVVTCLDRVQVQLCFGRLGRHVCALAHFVGDLVFILARRVVEVPVELQGAPLDLRVVLSEDQRSFVLVDHVFLEVFERLEADGWLAVGAPELNVRVDLYDVSLILLIFGDNVIEELQLVVIAAVRRGCLLLAGLPLLLLLSFGSCLRFLRRIADGLRLRVISTFFS